MHLKNLFTSLLHGEFRSIQLTSIFKLKPFTVDGVIKAGIRPQQGQILSVSELPGGLFCCDFRFRTNRSVLCFQMLSKLTDMKNGIADNRVIVIQILASCSELPVRELNLYGSSVRDSEKRVITAVDKPDTVFFLVHHLLPPFASGNSREN